MPLTIRGAGNHSTTFLINASWFNDYHDLLTGSMVDQPVTLANSLSSRGLTIKDSTSTTRASMSTAGVVSFDNGLITSDGFGNLSVAALSFTVGKISHLNWGWIDIGNCNFCNTVVTHSLGVVPTGVFIQISGITTTISFGISNVTSTQMTLALQGNVTSGTGVWWMVMTF